MTQEFRERHDDSFTPDEVAELIGEARDRAQPSDDGISYKELVEIAAEMGVSEEAIRDAVKERDRQRQEIDDEASEKGLARRKWKKERAGFRSHFASYVGVIGGIFLLDAVTGGGWWWYWAALGWGIGLFAHFSNVYLGPRPD